MNALTYDEYLVFLHKKVVECDSDIDMMVRAMDTELGKVQIKQDIEKVKRCYLDEIDRIEHLKSGR